MDKGNSVVTQGRTRRLPAKDLLEAEFRREIAPIMEAMRKHFEAEDAVLLSMFPGEAND